MNIQELIAKHTDADGNVDYDAVNKAVAESTQNQVGAAISKTKEKYKGAANEDKAAAEETKGQNAELMARLDKLEKAEERKAAAKAFKAKASELNVDSSMVDQIIASGANLADFDLEPFKGADVKKLDPHQGGAKTDDDEDKKEDDAARKKLLEDALKARVS